MLGVFFALLRVVKRLQLVQLREIFFDVAKFLDERMLVFAASELHVGTDFFNGTKDFHHQHAVMRDDGAPAFADDGGVWNLFRVANVGDVIDHVVRVFLQGIIRRAVERAAAAVVIHAESAAHVHELDLKTHLEQLRVKPRRFLHRLFHRENVRHLRADVKMQQLEAMPQIFRS